MSNAHDTFIRRSIELSQLAIAKGNHPFGSVLVMKSEILLEAENTVNTEFDVTGHAELNLVRNASQAVDASTLAKSTLYTSTEPCAMCAGAIYWAGIARVVYACSSESLARITGGNLLLPCREVFARGTRPVEVIGPILEEEALRVHQSFWK